MVRAFFYMMYTSRERENILSKGKCNARNRPINDRTYTYWCKREREEDALYIYSYYSCKIRRVYKVRMMTRGAGRVREFILYTFKCQASLQKPRPLYTKTFWLTSIRFAVYLFIALSLFLTIPRAAYMRTLNKWHIDAVLHSIKLHRDLSCRYIYIYVYSTHTPTLFNILTIQSLSEREIHSLFYLIKRIYAVEKKVSSIR